ncbi:MAG: zinc ribbon domain-containing protein [Clostridia bacterium]|nr:zinc ribbon domain-containing protein [Clostridia bacterium]
MLCPNCKKQIPDGTQFCPECGANTAANVAPVQKKKPITKKWWFWVIIAVVVIVFISAASGSDDSSDSSVNSGAVVTTTEKVDETTTEKITVTTTEASTLSEAEYTASCESIPYKDIARMPDNYVGKNVVFTGEVVQVMESSYSNNVTYRIDVTKDEYGYWDDTVYVTYELPEGAPRILEDDIVKFYGICEGTYTYETVLGSSLTIPSVEALYIDIQ